MIPEIERHIDRFIMLQERKGGQGHVKFKTSGRPGQSAWTVPSKTDWSSSANYSTVNTPILLTYLLTYPVLPS